MLKASAIPLIWLLTAASLTGCAGKAVQQTPGELTAAANTGGPWFCQPAATAGNWECDNDPARVANPVPDRAPQDLDAEAPAISVAPPAQTQTQVPAISLASAETAETAETIETQATAQQLPRYQQLAYQSSESLQELPPNFYTVQLTAMSTTVNLEQFIEASNLPPLTTVEIERDNELYYLLLLGVYEDFATAEQAATDLPAPLDQFEPWIRRLGTVQSAMLRAEQRHAQAPASS